MFARTQHVFGDMDRRIGGIEQRFEPFLAFDIGQAGQILAIEFEQVEGMQGELVLLALRAVPALEHLLQGGEIGIALAVVSDDFAVDQAGGQVERGNRLDQRAELVGPVLAVAGEHADGIALDRHQRAIAVELDLVHPAIAGRHVVDQRRELRLAVIGERGGLAALGLRLARIARGGLLHLGKEGIVLLSRQRIFALLVAGDFGH